MNLIACDQSCEHQREGYCTLNHIASLTSSTQSKCGYFEAKEDIQKPPQSNKAGNGKKQATG